MSLGSGRDSEDKYTEHFVFSFPSEAENIMLEKILLTSVNCIRNNIKHFPEKNRCQVPSFEQTVFVSSWWQISYRSLISRMVFCGSLKLKLYRKKISDTFPISKYYFLVYFSTLINPALVDASQPSRVRAVLGSSSLPSGRGMESIERREETSSKTKFCALFFSSPKQPIQNPEVLLMLPRHGHHSMCIT